MGKVLIIGCGGVASYPEMLPEQRGVFRDLHRQPHSVQV